MLKLKPLAEILAMSKDKIDESLAPLRARQAKSRADIEVAKLEEKAITLERKVHEACATKDIDFAVVADLMDEHALVERRAQQLAGIVSALFPAKAE